MKKQKQPNETNKFLSFRDEYSIWFTSFFGRLNLIIVIPVVEFQPLGCAALNETRKWRGNSEFESNFGQWKFRVEQLSTWTFRQVIPGILIINPSLTDLTKLVIKYL